MAIEKVKNAQRKKHPIPGGKPTDDRRVPRRTWRAFIAAYGETGNINKACEAAGCTYKQYRYWSKRYPLFREMLEEAEYEAGDMLEAEAVRRAKEGVRRPVLYRGKQVMLPKLDANGKPTGRKEPLYEVEYSDQMLMFLLRGFKPKKYGPKSMMDTTGGLPQVKEIEGASMNEV